MMKRYSLLLLLLLTTGCGTCLDNDSMPSDRIYGGVQADAKLFMRGWDEALLKVQVMDGSPTKEPSIAMGLLTMSFAAIDTPASFFCDTLLLPRAFYFTFVYQKPIDPITEAMNTDHRGIR
jgi:uncharacterized protein YceK